MTFARPALIGLAFALPGLFAVFVALYARRRRRVADLLGESELVARLGGGRLRAFPTARLVLLMLAGAALGVAAAGPKWGNEVTRGQAQALSVVLSLDISKSMLAGDAPPSRLEQERLLVRRMLREMPSDRFGLVVFAGRAYVLSPVTVDHSALELYMDALAPDIVSQGGSSLAAAITLSADLARGTRETSTEHAVVLMTDGEALEEVDGIDDAIARAARAGVRVYTVGIGTAEGAPVPDADPSTGTRGGFKRDEAGNVVISKMDAAMLQRIADKTGGEYIQLNRPGAADRLAQLLNKMDRTSETSEQRVTKKDRFGLFVLLALLCIVLDSILNAAPAPAATTVGAGVTRARLGRGAAGTSGDAAGARGTSGDAGTSGDVPAVSKRRGRRFTTAALLCLCFTMNGFGFGDLERGNRLYNERKYAEAVSVYQKALQSERPTPELYYNLGTSLLQLGRYEEGAKYLNSAIEGVEPEVRQRALYNLGNRFLFEARSAKDMDPNAKAPLLEAAVDAYKRSLRLNPKDADAKWNLEMALRDKDKNDMQKPQSGGNDKDNPDQQDKNQEKGGGAANNPAQSPSGPGRNQGSSQEQQPLSKEQADRILSASEQDERQLTRQKLRKGQSRTAITRDW